MLQIHMRNYEAFSDSRHQLLTVQPNLKLNWFALAISHHLLGRFDMAEKVLLTYWDGSKVCILAQSPSLAARRSYRPILKSNFLTTGTSSDSHSRI